MPAPAPAGRATLAYGWLLNRWCFGGWRDAFRRVGRPVFAVVFVLTVALLATVTGASASVNTSSVAWSGGGQVLCLQAFGSQLGSPVNLTAQCNPLASGQEWAFTHRGKLRAIGTDKYAVPGPGGTVLGTWAQAPAIIYGPGHTLSAGGMWLTHCPEDGPSPYLVTPVEPACQTWYVFTSLSP